MELISIPLLPILMLLSQFLAGGVHGFNLSKAKVPAVLAFGDSIVDTGNNNYIPTLFKSNFPPYGKDFPDGKATGRFSNGKITSDFIASKLGVKPLLPPYLDPLLEPEELLTGVSFASAGTGYDTFTSTVASVLPMSQQIDMFTEYKGKIETIAGAKKAASIIAESLYIVCAGSNDVVAYLTVPHSLSSQDLNSYSESLVKTASSFVQELVHLGAKKIGILGIPPIGCLPFHRSKRGSNACAVDHNKIATLYNLKLAKELKILATKFQGSKLVYIDVYSPMLDMIQHPDHYGFEVSKEACCRTGSYEVSFLCNLLTATTCTNASKFLFWDSYHPTERKYEILVDQLVKKYGNLLL